MENPVRRNKATLSRSQREHLLPLLLLTDAGETPDAPKRKELWDKIFEGLRHPILLLFLGSLVSYLLIPPIVSWINKDKLLAETRQKKAIEIVDKNSTFEGELYSLYARLGVFHNQSKELQEDDLKKHKETFRDEWAKSYTQFTREFPAEHLWVDDLVKQAIILKIVTPEDVKKLQAPRSSVGELPEFAKDIEDYKGNVGNSIGVIGELSNLIFNEKYDPKDKATDNKIAGDITKKYNDLRTRRNEIIDNLTKAFTQ